MTKLAVLCTFLAVMAAAESADCFNGCTIFTKYTFTVGDKVTDKLKDTDVATKCKGVAAPCPDKTKCMFFTPTIKADATIGEDDGKIEMASNSTVCLPDGSKMTKEACDTFETGIKLTLTGFKNVEIDCGKLSSASTFGFGALLVAILYIVF